MLLSPAVPSRKSRVSAALTYAILGAIVIVSYCTYLENRANPAHAYGEESQTVAGTGLAAFLEKPGHYLECGLRMVGSPLGRGLNIDEESATFAIGIALLSACALASIYVVLRWKNEALRSQSLPWFAIGGFGLACGSAITWGRAGMFSDVRALCPRYVSSVHFVAASALFLGAILVTRMSLNNSARNLVRVCAGILIAWLFVVWTSALDPLHAWRSARLNAKAELTLLPVVKRTSSNLLDAGSVFLHEQASYLNSKGWINPPMMTEPWLDQFAIRGTKPVSASRGGIEPLVFEGDTVVMRGHGSIPRAGRPADAVLICAEENGRRRIMAIADPDILRGTYPPHINYEFTPRHRAKEKLRHGWIARLPRNVYESHKDWTVWILDIIERRVHRIGDNNETPAVSPNPATPTT
jgi:hypothetical protein